MIANLGGCLDVYTNARSSGTVVGNGNNKGVVACRKSSDIGTCARIGVAGTVVLNVVAVCGVIRGRGPEVELQTCIGSNFGFGLFGSGSFGLGCFGFGSFGFGSFGLGSFGFGCFGFGLFGSGYFGLNGSGFACECDIGDDHFTCVSGVVHAPTGVDKEVEFACYAFKALGKGLFLACGNFHFAFHQSGSSSGFDLNGDVSGLGAVVLDLKGNFVLAIGNFADISPNVLIGVGGNVGVSNGYRTVFVVSVYAITVGGITAELNFNATDHCGEVTGCRICGSGRQGSGHIIATTVALAVLVEVFTLVRNFNFANGCELNVFNGNVTGTENTVVSGGVDHQLEFNAANTKADNELCGFACGDIKEGAAPFKVCSNSYAVHGCRDVRGLVVACEGGVEHIYANVNGFGTVVGNFEVNIVLACNSIGNVELDRHVCATGYVGVGYICLVAVNSYYVRSCTGECGNDGSDVCPVDLGFFFAFNGGNYYGRIEGSAFCAGSDPLILGTVVIGSTLVFAHPSPCSFIATPVVSEHSTCGRGELFNDLNVFAGGNGCVGSYLVNGLAVNKPGDGIFCPTEAVGVEFLGSVKAKVVHIFIAALAVNEEVELNVCGILAEEFDVDLVVRIGVAILEVVGTCANKEGACGTCVSRGLHANLIVAVVIVVLGACFTCGVVELNILIVEPSRCFFLGDAKAHNAVFIEHVVVFPNNVENVTVGPAVGFKQNRRICTVCKVDYLLCVESCIGQGNGLGFVGCLLGSFFGRGGSSFFGLSEKSANQIAQSAATERHNQCQCQCECYEKLLFHSFLLKVEKLICIYPRVIPRFYIRSIDTERKREAWSHQTFLPSLRESRQRSTNSS